MSVLKNLISLFVYMFAFQSQANGEIISSTVPLDYTNCETTYNPVSKEYEYEKSCLESWDFDHSFWTTNFEPWQDAIKKPISDRVVVADQKMLNFLAVDNLVFFGGSADGIEAVEDNDVIGYAKNAIANLPPSVLKYVEDHLYGIVLVKGLAYTAFAPEVFSVEGNSNLTGGAIILNVDNLRDKVTKELKTSDDWYTFKERTTLQQYDPTQKSFETHEVTLSQKNPDGTSTVQDLFNILILHEMAHVIAAADPSIHPSILKYFNKDVPLKVYEKMNKGNPLGAFPFIDGSWKKTVTKNKKDEDVVSLSRKWPSELEELVADKPVKFYSSNFDKKYTVDEAKLLYSKLQETCFVSMYATVSYFEDFAETMAQYFLKEKGYGAFEVKMTSKKTGEVEAQFSPDIWSNPTCSEKVQYIKDYFQE